MVTVRETGSIQWFPDVKNQSTKAPDAVEAQRQALSWIRDSDLIQVKASQLRVQGVASLYRTVTHRAGTVDPSIRVMQSVSLATEIGGIVVTGPNSTLFINVSANGIAGVSSTIRPIEPSTVKVQFKAADAVRQELAEAINGLRRGKSTVVVDSARLIYYEQGSKFVQPAYEFVLRITAEGTAPETHRILIGAAAQSPEPIAPEANAMEPWPKNTLARMLPLPGAKSNQADPTIFFGLYFNRLDYNEWASDPWDFWQNVRDGQSIGTNLFAAPTNYSMFLRQFQFNDVWMWQSGANYGNQSAQFVDRVHFAAVNGHGNKFSIAALQNWADFINLKSTRGFGAYNGNNGLTAYIEWRGCFVIPSPDPADQGSPIRADLEPWFALFKGLRGSYGFHSQMVIENLEGPQFGGWIGMRVPILSAWMQAVSSASGSACANTQSGSAESDCGSAVIVTAHENDTIFDLDPIKDPQELTVYWQRPASAATSAPFVP
jgi:hypothetical protein